MTQNLDDKGADGKVLTPERAKALGFRVKPLVWQSDGSDLRFANTDIGRYSYSIKEQWVRLAQHEFHWSPSEEASVQFCNDDYEARILSMLKALS